MLKKWTDDNSGYIAFCRRVGIQHVRFLGTNTRNALGKFVTSNQVCAICHVSSPLGHLFNLAIINDLGCLEFVEPFDSTLARAQGLKYRNVFLPNKTLVV